MSNFSSSVVLQWALSFLLLYDYLTVVILMSMMVMKQGVRKLLDLLLLFLIFFIISLSMLINHNVIRRCLLSFLKYILVKNNF